MHSLPISLSLALLAGLARSAPAPAVHPSEFTVTLTVPDEGQTLVLPVNAVKNGTDPQLVLVGEVNGPSPSGTPAYLDGDSPAAALVFDLTALDNSTSALYGAKVPDLGDAYGAAVAVAGVLGSEDRNWGVSDDGALFHKLYSGAEGFFACLDKVNGKDRFVLKFGVYTEDDQPPAGCSLTDLKVNHNIRRL